MGWGWGWEGDGSMLRTAPPRPLLPGSLGERSGGHCGCGRSREESELDAPGGTSRTGLRSRPWQLPSPSARGRTGAPRAASPASGAAPGPECRRGALPGSSGAQCCPSTVTTRPGAVAHPDPAAPCPKTAALLHACRPALNDRSLCPKSEAHYLKFATLYPMSASRALCLRPRAPGLQPLLVVFCTHLPPARPVGCAPYPQRGCPSLAAAHSTPGCGCRWRECSVRWGNPSPPHKWRSPSKPGSHLRA